MLSPKNIEYHSILKKFKPKKRRESDFFLFSYYKKWNLEMGEQWGWQKFGGTT